MSDIVERLRAKRQVMPAQGGGDIAGNSYITDDGKRLVNPDGPEAAETILSLRAAINDVLTHRRGELPTLGYIRDNDESRTAIARLAALATEAE